MFNKFLRIEVTDKSSSNSCNKFAPVTSSLAFDLQEKLFLRLQMVAWQTVLRKQLYSFTETDTMQIENTKNGFAYKSCSNQQLKKKQTIYSVIRNFYDQYVLLPAQLP